MTTKRLGSVALCLMGLALGCGARTGEVLLAPSSDASVQDVGVVVDATTADTPIDPRCAPLAAAIASKATPSLGSCTAVVRIDVATLNPLAYRLICGSYGGTNETQAFKQEITDTGLPMITCGVPSSISGSTPTDEYVYFHPGSAAACACCGDGWVGASNARTGLTVLGGMIRAGGASKGLTYPTTWWPATELGVGCVSSAAVKGLRGWDLTGASDTPPTLDALTLAKLTTVVQNTALPDGLGTNSYSSDGVVLKYAPTIVGGNAEFVVMVNSGFLEK